MKSIRVIAVVVFLFSASAWSQTPQIRDWYDEYGMVAWTSESIVLDNFAVYLAMNKSMIGYAAFVRGLNEPKSHFEQRIARVKSHLINKRGLAADQLIIIRVKKRKTTPWTVLQPIERDLRPPDFEKALGG